MIAKIILDSISPAGHRLTTVEMKYHRFIHPEWMTYRTFSRNSASSRAIPIGKEILKVLQDPAVPYVFGANQPGMQAGPALEGDLLEQAEAVWLEAALAATGFATRLDTLGVHKEVVNRLLEPFLWQSSLFTANSFDHLIQQRVTSPGAQAEFSWPAAALRGALNASEPTLLDYGEWHTPYVLVGDLPLADALRVSAARCARVSYLNHDGGTSVEEDIRLYEKLVDGDHMSPLEHVATPLEDEYIPCNFYGWNQFRKFIESGQLAL